MCIDPRRRSAKAVRPGPSTRSILGAVLLVAIGWSKAGENPADGAQAMLDELASVPILKASPPSGGAHLPDAPFREWSPADQFAITRRVAAICVQLWTMAHDAPGTRFLPPAQAASDEEELGADICMAAHMPADWPRRKAMVRSADEIISRAQALGSSLRLPSRLEH